MLARTISNAGTSVLIVLHHLVTMVSSPFFLLLAAEADGSALWFRELRWFHQLSQLIENIQNCLLMRVKALGELCLQLAQPFQECFVSRHGLPHFDKCTHNKEAHLHGSVSVQDCSNHDCAVLGKRVWSIAAPTVRT